ncbi:hypothetical protein VE03_01192 [Pseudogymnoascus sp. 23342-1-I1]|nr:hypothetical protein VE03_01192 [Pseudogymnoascus sp. 23342-1-I1]
MKGGFRVTNLDLIDMMPLFLGTHLSFLLNLFGVSSRSWRIPITLDTISAWRNLGSLGSHDLSAMREVLGFAVSYESSIDGVGRFDASIKIFAKKETVKICYDSPYVKGLPTILQIRETTPEGSYKESTICKTYEDPYTLEMKELYSVVVEGKQIKMTVVDAKEDLVIFGMILKAGVHPPNGAEESVNGSGTRVNGAEVANGVNRTSH